MIMRVINFIRRFIFILIATLTKIQHKRDANLSGYKKVLILRLDGIGDAILWLDAAKEYRNLFPKGQYELTVLCNQMWSSIAYVLPYFDKVVSLDKKFCYKELSYYYKFLKEIRKTGYDIVINTSFSRDFIFEDTIVWVSGAAKKIGSKGDLSNIRRLEKVISDKWYTQLLPATEKPLMELERNAEFMKGLGLQTFQSGVPQLPKINDAITVTNNKYYVLFPGASSPGKMWPFMNFTIIAERIYKKTGWTGVICGSESESSLGEYICGNTIGYHVMNMCGKTNLLELAEMIRGAEILISNDTSAVHIASAVNVPSICILGGGHFGRFVPYAVENQEPMVLLPRVVYNRMSCYHCNWKCKYNTGANDAYPCLSSITVDEVWRVAIDIIHDKLRLTGDDISGRKG